MLRQSMRNATMLVWVLVLGMSAPVEAQAERDWLASGLSYAQLLKFKESMCLACHAVRQRIVGPSWEEVAARYGGDPKASEVLADRVMKGSQGNWGKVPMPPNPKLSRTEAEDLVRVLLSLRTAVAAASEPAGAVVASRRVALVIGNGAYAAAPLRSPINDAAEMAKTLSRLGFDVLHRVDIKAADLEPALREFQQKLTPGAIALLYYSGHGARIDYEDYLFATDVGSRGAVDLSRDALSLGRVLDSMDERKTHANLVFLDTNRNNPFGGMTKSDTGPGAAVLKERTLVAFATSAGGVAGEGTQARHGLFTEHLLKELPTPGLTVEMMMKRVRTAVRSATNGTQVPWDTTSLRDDIVLARSNAGAAPTPPGASAAADAAAMLKDITDRAEKGDVSAMKFLAKVYRDGADGVERNLLTAQVWLIRAARVHNDGEAYYRLGQMYESGLTPDGKISLGAAGGSYKAAAELGHTEARRSYERIVAMLREREAPSVASDGGSSSFSFGDFLRGLGKVVGAAGMAYGVANRDAGMIDRGAALMSGDANEIARSQAAYNARQQAEARRAPSAGSGSGDCAQFARNRDIARMEASRLTNQRSDRNYQEQVAQMNDNAYQACISQ